MDTRRTVASSNVLGSYEKKYQDAMAANEKRYREGLALLDKAIDRYQPGGEFGRGAMAQFEQGKTQALAQGMQGLVSSGLSGTTVATGLPLAYEQEVGTPFRLQLEDMRMQNLTQAEMAKTGFIERRTDAYPDPNLMANLQTQASSGPAISDNRSNFLETWGAPDPGVTARNQADAQQKQLAYLQLQERNKQADAKRRSLTTSTQPQGKTPSMSEVDYQSILNQNLAANNLSTKQLLSTPKSSNTQEPFHYVPETTASKNPTYNPVLRNMAAPFGYGY
jgi:hypothetical protein